MPHWLYLWPLDFVIVGFVVFGAIFLLREKRSRDKTRKADQRSFIAIFIQALAFAIGGSSSDLSGVPPWPGGGCPITLGLTP